LQWAVPQTMELAADAIRGHRSAHSFATGPVIADPVWSQKSAMYHTCALCARLSTLWSNYFQPWCDFHVSGSAFLLPSANTNPRMRNIPTTPPLNLQDPRRGTSQTHMLHFLSNSLLAHCPKVAETSKFYQYQRYNPPLRRCKN